MTGVPAGSKQIGFKFKFIGLKFDCNLAVFGKQENTLKTHTEVNTKWPVHFHIGMQVIQSRGFKVETALAEDFSA